MNFWAKFGMLVVLFLIFDETESYLQRFFNGEPIFLEKESSDNQGE